MGFALPAAIGARLGRLAAPRMARALTVGLLGVAVGGGAWSTWRFHPLQLSYYNALIGGLSGATRAGMEPTFYWEAVTPDVREWLNAHTEEGRSVAFDIRTIAFEYLHHWGLLRPSPVATASQAPPDTTAGGRPRTGRPRLSSSPVWRASASPSLTTRTR